jgi:hypothetical protein
MNDQNMLWNPLEKAMLSGALSHLFDFDRDCAFSSYWDKKSEWRMQ